MVGTIASWRCKCGIRVKVLAEADLSQSPATQVALCSNCGESQTVQGDMIVSVTEGIPDTSPALELMHGSGSSVSPCSEKEGFIVAHNKAFDMYLEIMSELATTVLRHHTEFDFLYNRVQIARQLFVQTRERLKQHTAQYGC